MPRHYSDWIAAYTSTFASRSESPFIFHFLTACSTIAGALTRNVYIDETLYRLYPNLYVIFVADPGNLSKSTTVSIGINMLRQLDHCYLAASNTTYPAFLRDLAQHSTEIADGADYIRQCAVTASISELGTFLKTEDEEMLNGLTDLWDCGALLVKDTKTNGTDIVEHPFVNIIGGTTPSWCRTKLPHTIGGWGLSSRIMFVYADKKSQRIARPSKMWQNGDYEHLSQQLVHDLQLIAELNGPMEFTPEADQLAYDWYVEHGACMEAYALDPLRDPWVLHFLARKQAHVHKLAMIFSASRREDKTIHLEDIQDAIQYVDLIEAEISKIFKPLPQPTRLASTEQAVIEQIIAEIKSTADGCILRLTAFSRLSRYVDSSTAGRMLDNAIACKIFKSVQRMDNGRATWWLEAGDE